MGNRWLTFCSINQAKSGSKLTYQIQQFIAIAKGHRYYIAFALALGTGMRSGEILALRWRDIDFEVGKLKVARSFDRAYDGTIIVNNPKTAKGIREIALPRQLIQELKTHRLKQKEERLAWGKMYVDNDLVVAKEDGNSMLPCSLREHWYDLQEKAGVPRIRLHDARHTHASLMLSQSISPKIISGRLGHATISITLDLYSHTYSEMHEEAATKFGDAIFGNG